MIDFVAAYLIVIVTSAVFSVGLSAMATLRTLNSWLYFALPLLLVLTWWDRQYRAFHLSSRVEVSSLSQPGGAVSNISNRAKRFAGLLLIVFAWIAHLFGASVGREGVGLQLGGWAARAAGSSSPSEPSPSESLSGLNAYLVILRNPVWQRACLMATGFTVIFGTPLTAVLFIFESHRSVGWRSLLIILVLSLGAHAVVPYFGLQHQSLVFWSTDSNVVHAWVTLYQPFLLFLMGLTLGSVLLVVLFSSLSLLIERTVVAHRFHYYFAGAFLILTSLLFFQTGEMTGLPGLGTQLITKTCHDELAIGLVLISPIVFALGKTVLTAIFVGLGVRGGEVTPLLMVGLVLAQGLAQALELPMAGALAVGLPAVWGIAAKRPLAAVLLSIEYFGIGFYGVHAVLVFFIVALGMRAVGFLLEKVETRWPATVGLRAGLYQSKP